MESLLLSALRVHRGDDSLKCEQRHAAGRSFLAPLMPGDIMAGEDGTNDSHFNVTAGFRPGKVPSMLMAAFDVHYLADGRASAAAVLFNDYKDPHPVEMMAQCILHAAGYIAGQFYKRELPCILELLARIDRAIDEIVIDGYVRLGTGPGLGRYLFESLGGQIPVIGVAKNRFAGASGAEILRGRSRRPLYITCVGVDQQAACEKIRSMHGPHRIPTLLKLVDRLARAHAREIELGVGAGMTLIGHS